MERRNFSFIRNTNQIDPEILEGAWRHQYEKESRFSLIQRLEMQLKALKEEEQKASAKKRKEKHPYNHRKTKSQKGRKSQEIITPKDTPRAKNTLRKQAATRIKLTPKGRTPTTGDS